MTAKTPQLSERERLHVAKIIRRAVSYFNGWWVSEDAVQKSCEKAAAKVVRYLRKKAGR